MKMKTTVAGVVVVGALASMGALPAAGQAVWEESAFPGGMEFRLRNAEGAAIVLQCLDQGIGAGFALPAPLGATERASVRAVPGRRRNVAVTSLTDRVIKVDRSRGLDFVLDLLRTSARLDLRISDQQASFDVLGSESIVHRCGQQEAPLRLPPTPINLSFATSLQPSTPAPATGQGGRQ